MALTCGSTPHRFSPYPAVSHLPYPAVSHLPDIGAEATELLRKVEAAAATTAMPVPGVQEALHACHASGRCIAVVGDTSSEAMETYLDMHGLRQLGGAVNGREHLLSLPVSLQTGEILLQHVPSGGKPGRPVSRGSLQSRTVTCVGVDARVRFAVQGRQHSVSGWRPYAARLG
ncbi:hypothetical protein GCM10012289_58430 [Nonomuraea cavernae]|uniref:Uncharacterized protein n=1 Tax=Nonomuraea cavernae TaxID=2045107 RepID=A0A917Z942_9ACTN|nr:hypothetical protein GCM10012289_58430 [Nonomuraea cavernae]